MQLSVVAIPKTAPEAFQHPAWRQAIEAKMVALSNSHTWDLVDPLVRCHHVDCCWVFSWDLVDLHVHCYHVDCYWVFFVKYYRDSTIDR